MKTRTRCAIVLVTVLTLLPALASAEEYFLAPIKGIMCTIRTHEAIGTDTRSDEQLFMEIITVSSDTTLQSRTFSVDRNDFASGWTQGGGYDVFRRNCAAILGIIPDELRDTFMKVFSITSATAPAE